MTDDFLDDPVTPEPAPEEPKKNKGGRPKKDTVPLADFKRLEQMFLASQEMVQDLSSKVRVLEDNNTVLVEKHKPFAEADVETEQLKIAKASTVKPKGKYRYTLRPTFGEDRIPFKKSFDYACDVIPEKVNEETGEVDKNTATRVVTDYSLFSGSKFDPEDVEVKVA